MSCMREHGRAICVDDRAVRAISMEEKRRRAHLPRMLHRRDSRAARDGSRMPAVTQEPPARRARDAACQFCEGLLPDQEQCARGPKALARAAHSYTCAELWFPVPHAGASR
ncbi:hypothetical protein F01_440205 [Burkholderia cenocepacia]|nr:hypothetical protein F01_440205 [Burkholderia cenocepacia]